MKWIQWIFLLFPTFLLADITWQTHEQGISVNVSLSSDSISLYEVLDMEIVLRYPERYQVNKQDLIESILLHANPLNPIFRMTQQSSQDFTDKGFQLTHLHLQLTPLTTGLIYLTLLKIDFNPKEPDEKPISIVVPVFKLNITVPAPTYFEFLQPASLLPIAPEYPVDLSQSNRLRLNDPALLEQEAQYNLWMLKEHTFPWIEILSVLLAILGWNLWQRYRAMKRAQKVSKLVIPPKQKVLESLLLLRQENLPRRGMYQDFYVQLTNLVRYYLEKQFQLPVTSQTTEEFIQEAAVSTRFQEPLKEALTHFLEDADRVKFARYQPSIKDCERAYQAAMRIIQSP